MNSSGWSNDDIDTSKRSKLFIYKETTIADYSLITYPDGGCISSSKDLSLFLSELIKGYNGNGTILQNKSYQKLFQKRTFENITPDQQFWIFMEFRNEFIGIKDNMIGQNGGDPGVVTFIYFNPENNIGKILFVNTETDDNYAWPEIQMIWKYLVDFSESLN